MPGCSGGWLAVEELPGVTAIDVEVHAGDFLCFLSRGRINAMSHRVVRPASGLARLSFPLLMRPRKEWRVARNYNMPFDGDESSSESDS